MKTTFPASGDVEMVAAIWISRKEEGLTPEQKSEFERWLSESPAHVEAIARKSRVWAAFGAGHPEHGRDTLIHGLGVRQKRRIRRRLAVAATAVALVAGGYGWMTLRPLSLSEKPTVALILPERQILPDGSRVDLKPGATLSVKYGETERRLELSTGGAHFEVAPAASRPFVVMARGVAVRAVGTAFSVQLSDADVGVVVTEGRVAVEKENTAAAVIVDAGSSVSVDLAKTSAPISPASPVPPATMAQQLAWLSPKLEFSQMPLGEAVALFNRHTQVRLVVDDPNIAQFKISGLFRADNTESFLWLLETSMGIKAERFSDRIALKKAP